MQAKLRTRLAAVLLLSPVAALLAAPAAATPAVVGYRHVVSQPVIAIPAPVIGQFSVRADGPVEPGRLVRFHLEGTAGAQVTLEIPGIARELALREVRQGVYQGGYVMRVGQDPYAFTRIVASMRNGPFETTARARLHGDGFEHRHGRGWGWRDTVAPRITDLTPSHGDRVHERGRTRVSARIQDDRSGVDLSSVRLRIDGRDVTRDTRVENDEIRYRDDLPRGRHVAELVVRDRAGNLATRSWSFEVRDRHEGYGYGWGNAGGHAWGRGG